MATTRRQRRDIEDIENCLAILSMLDSLLCLLALHLRQKHLLHDLAAGRAAIQRGQATLMAIRQRFHEDAGG